MKHTHTHTETNKHTYKTAKLRDMHKGWGLIFSLAEKGTHFPFNKRGK